MKVLRKKMMDPYKTRQTLIERVKNQQDDQSWAEFALVYQDYIYAIIRRMNISAADADDLHQQVLLNLWNQLPKLNLDEIKRFRNVVSTVTKQRVIDFIRKCEAEKRRNEKLREEEAHAYLEQINLSNLDAIVEQEWEIHLVNMAISKIEHLFSGQAVEIFRMNLTGKTVDEIAKEAGLKVNSVYRLRNRVKVRLVREIEHLRQELE